jgi:hypothetical protein
VLIELDGQGEDLALELAQATGQPVTLLAKGLGQRDHRLDEPTLALGGGWNGVHRLTSTRGLAAREQAGCRGATGSGTHTWARAAVAGLTA